MRSIIDADAKFHLPIDHGGIVNSRLRALNDCFRVATALATSKIFASVVGVGGGRENEHLCVCVPCAISHVFFRSSARIQKFLPFIRSRSNKVCFGCAGVH